MTTWMTCTTKKGDKFYAQAISAHHSENLLMVLQRYPDAVHVNICSSKKEARTVAEEWNKGYAAQNLLLDPEELL